MKDVCAATSNRLAGSLRYAIALFALALGFALSADAADSGENPNDLPNTGLGGKRSSYVPTPNELLTRYAPATVKLTLKKFGVPLAAASGYFASADGTIITHSGLMSQLLADNASSLEITTSDKKTIKEWRFLGCGRTRAGVSIGRLCALQAKYKPKLFFAVAHEAPLTGSDANVIGHPGQLDFTIMRGTIVTNDKSLSLRANLEDGHAGGPVFNNEGQLLGAADVDDEWDALTDSNADRDTKIATAHEELEGFTEFRGEGLSLAEARVSSQAKKIEELRRLEAQELAPALDFAAQAKPLSGLTGFHDETFAFGDHRLTFTIPNLFDDCGFTEKRRESTLHACSALGGAALLSIRRKPLREDLLARNGQRLIETKPLDAVARLTSQDAWDLFEPMLNDGQKRALQSEVSVAQCQAVRANAAGKPPMFFSGSPACRFSVTRDETASGQSVSVWLAKDQDLYEVSIWMNDSRLADYFARVPSLAIMTARRADTAVTTRVISSTESAKPSANYKVTLPDAYSFKTARADGKGHQVDFYGKKLLLDQFEDTITVAIKASAHAYLPPDFDGVAAESAREAAKIFGAKVQTKTMESEALTVAGQGARLITAFATDAKGRSALLLSATIYFADQTYEVAGLAATKDPSDAFREFKKLLDGFKRR